MSGNWVDLLELGVAGTAITLYSGIKASELRQGFRQGTGTYDGEVDLSYEGEVPSAEEIGQILGEKTAEYAMPEV